MSKRRQSDSTLLRALTEAYTARAKLFHNGIRMSGVDLLVAEIDALDVSAADWSERKLPAMGITGTAMRRVKATGAQPHQVFAHPDFIASKPHLIAYYRNMATLSRKGIAQVLFPTERYESKAAATIPPDDALRLCRALNEILSGVIDSAEHYDVSISRKAILAEIGAQLQGTWNNRIGQGAARTVQRVLEQHIVANGLGVKAGPRRYELRNGWSVVFGSEPDVAFLDAQGTKQIAIEIKGSLDVAGAQTRYGEAKKTFAKQLEDNPRCYTIYLASCFTDSVIRQINADGQVRDWFNLTAIVYDEAQRQVFLRRVFHVASMPRA
jgi:hypothetical protein